MTEKGALRHPPASTHVFVFARACVHAHTHTLTLTQFYLKFTTPGHGGVCL